MQRHNATRSTMWKYVMQNWACYRSRKCTRKPELCEHTCGHCAAIASTMSSGSTNRLRTISPLRPPQSWNPTTVETSMQISSQRGHQPQQCGYQCKDNQRHEAAPDKSRHGSDSVPAFTGTLQERAAAVEKHAPEGSGSALNSSLWWCTTVRATQ